MKAAPTDGSATRYPVSVKGVVINDSRVLLLKNERDEWELPGGKLELTETPEECVVREILEETGLRVAVSAPLSPYVYLVADVVPVVILPFLCSSTGFEGMLLSHEHKEIDTFHVDHLDRITLPDGYRKTVRAALRVAGARHR